MYYYNKSNISISTYFILRRNSLASEPDWDEEQRFSKKKKYEKWDDLIGWLIFFFFYTSSTFSSPSIPHRKRLYIEIKW